MKEFDSSWLKLPDIAGASSFNDDKQKVALMVYKGYIGFMYYATEDKCYICHLIGIEDSITNDGDTIDECAEYFKHSVDEYLEMCKAIPKEPNTTNIEELSPQYIKDLINKYVYNKE